MRKIFIFLIFITNLVGKSIPYVKILNVNIIENNDSITILGKAGGYNLNISIPVIYDSLQIILESKNKINSKYPVFSEWENIAKGCTFAKGRCLKPEEKYGKDITTITIFNNNLRKIPVWEAYGGLGKWSKNAPNNVIIEFKKVIKNSDIISKIKGKKVRLHAILKQASGGPFAAWPAITYFHDVKFKYINNNKNSKIDKIKKDINLCKEWIKRYKRKLKVLKEAKDNALMQVSGATPSYYQNIIDDYNAHKNIQKYGANPNYVLYEYSPLDRSVYLSSLIKMYQNHLKAQKNNCQKLENELKRLQK